MSRYETRDVEPSEIIRPQLLLPGRYGVKIARSVAQLMGGGVEVDDSYYRNTHFACGEICPTVQADLEDKNVAVISSYRSGNDKCNVAAMETYMLGQTARDWGARHVSGVLLNMYGARQDRLNTTDRQQQPLTVKGEVDRLRVSGFNRLITIDPHSNALYDYCDDAHGINPQSLYIERLKAIIGENPEKYIIIAPDKGSGERLGSYQQELGVDVLVMKKDHDKFTGEKRYSAQDLSLVNGKTAIVIDDMIDSAGTMLKSAIQLEKEGEAEGLIAVATHTILSGNAVKNLKNPAFTKVIATDGILKEEDEIALGDKLDVVPIAPLIARYFTGQLACRDVATRGKLKTA
ncbi:ribose-phosphate diphosphokinase [Candidatus Saccharibacteria bacterium]|nr:ribose-phosphate diphosphokinase [Candidatus Saccharibacteria bacterium]MCL1962837.1 ribose-phosphate diphosphokinase [Candidatus Saccharibacteria bacterium]